MDDVTMPASTETSAAAAVWPTLYLDHLTGPGALWRGEHKLPHQSQKIRRDLHGEQILLSPGARAHVYMLTDQQVQDRCLGRDPGLPYRFLVSSPESAALSWTAFYDEAALRAFTDAYTLTIEGDLNPGKSFSIRLPETSGEWLPATRRVPHGVVTDATAALDDEPATLDDGPLADIDPAVIESLVRLAVTTEMQYDPVTQPERQSAYGLALNSFSDPDELRALARSIAPALDLADDEA